MIIMIDSPKGAYYGAQVSAPIFRDTLQQILVAQGVQPSNKADLKTMDSLAEKDGGKEGTLLQSCSPVEKKTVRLPNLAGWSLRGDDGDPSKGRASAPAHWQRNQLQAIPAARDDPQ